MITGDPEPHLYDTVDQRRVGLMRGAAVNAAHFANIDEGRINWTIVGFPTPGWAQTLFGVPDVRRLFEAIATSVRLDEPDPIAAWNEHILRLKRRAAALNNQRFDAVHFRGPGTDLIVGLIPQASWRHGILRGPNGRSFVANMPTDEVLTTPHRLRTDGYVRATMPFVVQGVLVEDLELRLAGGRVVGVQASRGLDVVRAQLGEDEGAPYLGEVALVDEASRVAALGMRFENTLLDENASCHIAYGNTAGSALKGDAATLPPTEQLVLGVNQSHVHTDLMIGGPGVDVDGLRPDGRIVPLLRGNAWQLD